MSAETNAAAVEDEVEVTAEMIRAGADVIWDLIGCSEVPFSEDLRIAKAVYLAMEAARKHFPEPKAG